MAAGEIDKLDQLLGARDDRVRKVKRASSFLVLPIL